MAGRKPSSKKSINFDVETPLEVKTDKAGNVPLTTKFTGDVFSRIRKYKSHRGFMFEQDVIRLAVSFFLDKEGF